MSYPAYDLAVQQPAQLTVTQLERFLDDVRLQPGWRLEADKACDWYDGNQLDAVTLQRMENVGIPPLITNLIKPTVDLVLGMEAKTRADPRVNADSDEWQEVAEAQSAKLMEAKRESNADIAISDAYAEQVKAGIGWTYVGRSFDPFRYPYVVSHVPRNEIWWDWHADERDLSDARWLIRRKWYDVDFLAMVFSRHADLITRLIGSWAQPSWDPELMRNYQYGQSLELMRSFRVDQAEWLDSLRRRLCLYEVWYRHWVRGHVMRLPSGRVVEVDVRNPRHAQAILRGMVTPEMAVYSKVRLAWWIGPFRLEDVPYNRRHFPYVPFWGNREDKSKAPYGVTRAMMSPQEETNARFAKAMWMMSAKRITYTKRALSDPERARREAARPDAMFELSDAFDKQRDVFEIQDHIGLTAQQLEVMQERKQAINAAAGIFQPMLGDPDQKQSGIAIASLVEQGTTTLAEINDNYRNARRLTFEYLLEEVTEDLAKERNAAVTIKKPGKQVKTVYLNVPSQDDMGEFLENDVARALTKVGIEDVPGTAAYRAQMAMMLGEMAKSLPPQLQAFVVPFILRSSELPDRHDIADMISKALGLGEEGPPDPRLEQAAMQVQQLTELAQKMQAALQEAQVALKSKEAEVQVKHRDLDLKERELQTRQAETDAVRLEREGGSRTEQERLEIERRKLQLEEATRAMELAKSAVEMSKGLMGEDGEEREEAVRREDEAKIEGIRKEASQLFDKLAKELAAVAKESKSEMTDLRKLLLETVKAEKREAPQPIQISMPPDGEKIVKQVTESSQAAVAEAVTPLIKQLADLQGQVAGVIAQVSKPKETRKRVGIAVPQKDGSYRLEVREG